MKTGIELIHQEREEQKKKHGYLRQYDAMNNRSGQLIQAAMHCLFSAGFGPSEKNAFNASWPLDWSSSSMLRIQGKTKIEKLVVAGALLLAEQERTGFKSHAGLIEKIAKNIDYLLQTTDLPGNSPTESFVSEGAIRPAHYGGEADPFEPRKVICAWGLGFNLGNVIKYVARAGKKDPAKEIEDLEKAGQYIRFQIEELKNKQVNATE